MKEAALKREMMMEKAREEARRNRRNWSLRPAGRSCGKRRKPSVSIRNEAATLSLTLAERILREKLGTEQEQKKMIDRLFNEMDISKS